MGLSSLHVCMESSADHWLQGTIHEESGMDSSSPSGGGDMLTCSRPMIERRLRPPHDQALKCPRCDSTHTKFCYYNNYSLSQPRYFCKTCRRYWTKGGTLRNIPVGGGCRKNKKVSAKKSNNDHHLATNNNNQNQTQLQPSYHHPKDLQLSFPDVQFSHLSNWTNAGSAALGNPINNFMENKYNSMLEINNPRPIDFMESKLEGIIGSSSSRNNNFDFFGNSTDMSMAVGMVGGGDIMNGQNGLSQNFHGLCNSPAFGHGGMSYDGGNNNNGAYNLMDSCQRLMLPYDQANHEDIHNAAASIDVKPNPKLLSLEWQDQQGCSDHAGKESSFGYLNGPGSWTGMMNGYGSSTTNPLV